MSRRILIIRPDRIGDVVLATPLIRALRSTFPDAWLAAMVQPYTRDVLVGNPHLDEVIVDDLAGGFLRMCRSLRGHRFDTSLLLLPTKRHAWMAQLAGIRQRVGTGSKPYVKLTCTKTVSRNRYVPLRHEADYCLDLGRAIGVVAHDLSVEIFLSEGERARGRELLAGAGVAPDAMIVGVHPGSGHSAPNWPAERYADLCRRILDRSNAHIVVTGGPAEAQLAEPFRALDRARVSILIGALPLRETMTVIAQFRLLVSASTGTMHIAAGLGVRTVSLFCPVTACSPDLWGPKGNEAEIVLPGDGYCQVRCPGDPHICTFDGGIDVEPVARRVLAVSGS